MLAIVVCRPPIVGERCQSSVALTKPGASEAPCTLQVGTTGAASPFEATDPSSDASLSGALVSSSLLGVDSLMAELWVQLPSARADSSTMPGTVRTPPIIACHRRDVATDGSAALNCGRRSS